MPNPKNDILAVMDSYNKSFGDANYSKIIKLFDLPASFNLEDKTITASSKFKLKLIYKKIRGDLPDYYSYSKWKEVKIKLIDSNIAIVDADFIRHKKDGSAFDSGSAQYHLRLEENGWKIFSLTPYKTIVVLD
tara:strand:+ start:885 stop:1283 length:399 start_codon:yes stop_codon:yes gene_type:complete